MKRAEAEAVLARHQDELRERGAISLALTGPILDGRDVGIYGEIDIRLETWERPFGLFQLVGLKLYLEKILGHPVNLMTSKETGRQDSLRRT